LLEVIFPFAKGFSIKGYFAVDGKGCAPFIKTECPMKNLKASRVNVMVSNMDKSVAFYHITLGLDLINRYGNHYAEIQAADLLIGLHPISENIIKGNNLSIGFGVAGFDATLKELEAKGIRFELEQDGWIRLAYFKDLDDNQLFLAERKD
jgi:catechol 2,3-dioxygenase-like lactoylglutathione lyase family enzyme